MNRVLRRPMFRIGGSAGTGITSGLDAPRKKFKDGSDPYDRALKTTTRAMEDLEKFRGTQSGLRPGSLPGFLTQFGLNLASATPTGTGFGGLVATAAKAAQTPFQTFQAAKLAEREDRADRAEDIFSGALASEYDILEAEKKGGSATQYAKSQAADALGKIYQADIANIQTKIDKLDPTADADQIKEYEADIQDLKRQLKADQKAIFLGADTDQEYQRQVILKLLQAGEDIEDILEFFPDAATIMGPGFKLPEEAKDGGRIGLARGSKPMMESVVEAEKETGEVQDLSYTQLRSRLPQEISNEIVMLLANSKQALLDFANIQTTQDIQSFNQQYDVNLTLPQGA